MPRSLQIAFFLATASAALSQPRYDVREILVEGKVGEFCGLGNNGWVAGSVDLGSHYSAFRWRDGFAELLDSPHPSSSAYAVNDEGDSTGGAGDDSAFHAALWDSGGYHDLDDLGGGQAAGLSINDRKWVVGLSYVYPRDGEFHPFLYRNGAMEDLGLLGIPQNRYSKAVRINSQNAVIGWETRWRRSIRHAMDLDGLRRHAATLSRHLSGRRRPSGYERSGRGYDRNHHLEGRSDPDASGCLRAWWNQQPQ